VRAKAKGVKVVILNPGESYEFARKGKKKG
jgi:hypothetical protein